MAVYTPFERADLEAVCELWGLGSLQEARGVPQGSINTNYLLEAQQGRFFLRHTTARSESDLVFEAELLEHLHASAFPAPTLLRTADDRPFVPMLGGRASVFRFLPGEERGRPELSPEHVLAVGAELGKLHRVGNSFCGERENPYGPQVVRGWLRALCRGPAEELRPVAGELEEALDRAEDYGALVPRGVIHADLFMDNVKWLGDKVGAFFDFEMACQEALVLDLGITLNAWCFEGRYQVDLCRALYRGYATERPLSPGEPQALYRATLFGAVRYTASRIRDFHLSALPADRLFPKDYRTYLRRVRALRELGEAGFVALLGA